jgi:hypothetical protein
MGKLKKKTPHYTLKLFTYSRERLFVTSSNIPPKVFLPPCLVKSLFIAPVLVNQKIGIKKEEEEEEKEARSKKENTTQKPNTKTSNVPSVG